MEVAFQDRIAAFITAALKRKIYNSLDMGSVVGAVIVGIWSY